MSQRLPELPKPESVLITVEAPPEVPSRIAADLEDTGIPGGLIGYEYRPLSEPVYCGEIGERGLVAIAASGLSGRLAIDVASHRVVPIPDVEPPMNHVNRDLGSFNRCVAAVIARFPFYTEDGEDECDEVAQELRALLCAIDGTALAYEGFWDTFCWDVAIGDYADWDA